MSLKNPFAVLIVGLLLLGASSIFAQTNNGQETVIVGTIEKIDPQAKTVSIRHHDKDLVSVLAWTGKTTAHGIKKAAIWTAHEAHVGTHVAAHAIKVAGVDTLKSIGWFGKGTAKVTVGTVRYVGKTGKQIGLTVAGGAEEVFDVSEHALVVAGRGVGHGAKIAAKDTAKAATATVHFVESGGKKFIHFIEHKKFGSSTSAPVGSWRWTMLTTPVEKISVPNPEKYTLEIMADGKARILADCNRGMGSYKLDGSNLTFPGFATTKMACPPGSLDSKYLQSLDAARIFRVEGDALYVDLFADGGTMMFTRVN